jgi:FixJ family two-component response regulator
MIGHPITGHPMIYLVDDDPAVRDSLSLLLEEEGFALVAFASAEDFLSSGVPMQCSPSCCIVDIRMPGMDGMALQEEMVKRGIVLPVILLTGHGTIPQSVRAIKSGAVDFLTKPVTATTLLQSVRDALHECDRLMAKNVVSMTAATRLESLTDREREVLALVVTGLPNKEVARRLGISHRTVEIHKARIMFKTGVDNVFDLARLAELGQTHT